MIKACTKNDSIQNKNEKTNELIQRCAQNGQEALIIKTADIIDSFEFYTLENNQDQLDYCHRNAAAIFQFKPVGFADPIFNELQKWHEKNN